DGRCGGEADLHLAAHTRRGHAQPETAALEGGGRVEAGGGALGHRVLAEAVHGHVQDHRAGVVLDGQVAGDPEPVRAGRFDRGAAEGGGRVLVGFEEVGAAQVRVEV